jgi:hypothetical protein
VVGIENAWRDHLSVDNLQQLFGPNLGKTSFHLSGNLTAGFASILHLSCRAKWSSSPGLRAASVGQLLTDLPSRVPGWLFCGASSVWNEDDPPPDLQIAGARRGVGEWRWSRLVAVRHGNGRSLRPVSGGDRRPKPTSLSCPIEMARVAETGYGAHHGQTKQVAENGKESR